jgi:competence protein ComEC
MPVLHFLNVNDGDCSIIEHISGRITVIDVCNAREVTPVSEFVEKISKAAAMEESGVSGNFNQKKYPVNPISYMRDRDLNSVFRLILTHPDMDHMDGMKDFFESFSPGNFWDTDNAEGKGIWGRRQRRLQRG